MKVTSSTHSMYPKVRFGREHDHPPWLWVDVIARFCGTKHSGGRLRPLHQDGSLSQCSLGEIDQRFGQTDLSKHAVSRDSTLFGGVKQNMSLLFGILVIWRSEGCWVQSWIEYCEICETRRNSVHPQKTQWSSLTVTVTNSTYLIDTTMFLESKFVRKNQPNNWSSVLRWRCYIAD